MFNLKYLNGKELLLILQITTRSSSSLELVTTVSQLSAAQASTMEPIHTYSWNLKQQTTNYVLPTVGKRGNFVCVMSIQRNTVINFYLLLDLILKFLLLPWLLNNIWSLSSATWWSFVMLRHRLLVCYFNSLRFKVCISFCYHSRDNNFLIWGPKITK